MLIRKMNGELNNVQSMLWVSILHCKRVCVCVYVYICVLYSRIVVTYSLLRPEKVP